jgi:hypothetical protein
MPNFDLVRVATAAMLVFVAAMRALGCDKPDAKI